MTAADKKESRFTAKWKALDKKKKGLVLFFLIFGGTLGILSLIYLPTPFKSGISGLILADQTWEGTVHISGDVVAMPWVTITVKPGTTVTVAANSADVSMSMPDTSPDDLNTGDPTVDANAGGWDYTRTHIAINILGKLISKGTPSQPIRFVSDAPTPTYTDWEGISAKYAEFEYTEIAYSNIGFYSTESFERVTFNHCYVHHAWGAGIGFLDPVDRNEMRVIINDTTIQDCGHEAIDTHSSGRMNITNCRISESQVGLNLRDDIPGNLGMNVNVRNCIIVNCNWPVLVAGPTVATIRYCTIEAETQDTSRWHYGSFTMHQFTNPMAIRFEDGAQDITTIETTMFFGSPFGIWNDNGAVSGTVAFNYVNFDNVPAGNEFRTWIQTKGTYTTYASGFVNAPGGDFTLAVGSACLMAGPSGTQIGAYGGGIAPGASIGWHP
ncbi:MAG: right-handed parallel beta-helix repeat-containing protein [Candidatus Lokiarchaeota archaeon]|nr:right-handed parallel beta-helix repeat-containing protein [Candidatus Lokiarchaeota archaeon]